MSWLVSAKQYIPAVIGEPFGGGYFAGYISHTADGNPTHALIVAPRATGASGGGYPITTGLAWKTTNTDTANTASDFDGVANTASMVTAGIANHPAAQFCVNLNIAGFTDWYMPARQELDIAYFNLKPNQALNTTNWGANSYSVPRRNSNYTAQYPLQTGLSLFSGSGSQRFEGNWHQSSTQNNATVRWVTFWGTLSDNLGGNQATDVKTQNSYVVRAFRRIAL